MEGESMRVMYEPWFVKYKVDLVFAGHVHAYERTVSRQILSKALLANAIAIYVYIPSYSPRILIILLNSVSFEIGAIFGAFLCVFSD